jgi:hypothetical protein
MSLAMFAAICDKCAKRSEEYGNWPWCFECLCDVCPECDVESQRNDEANRTLCKGCAARIIA